MLKEDFCSYEVAKLLKEKGFDEPLKRFYNSEGKRGISSYYNWNLSDCDCSCPTHQMAMKWLREKYCLHFVIQPMMSMPSCELKWVADTYDTSIFYKELSEFKCVAGTKLCDSPEEAVEEALKYSLENLI